MMRRASLDKKMRLARDYVPASGDALTSRFTRLTQAGGMRPRPHSCAMLTVMRRRGYWHGRPTVEEGRREATSP
jgi:hypothetical protein